MSVLRDDARFACEVAVKIHCPSWSDYLELYTTNLSKGGVFVASKLSAPLGERVSVDLALPSGAVVRLSAKVVHHNGPVAGMGLEFVEIDKETREALEAMLTVARFTVKSAAPAPVAAPTRPVVPEVEQTLLNELSRRMDLLPHQQLGVDPGASADEIDAAFFRLCERYHPVSFETHSEDTQALVTKLNELLHAAYDQLSGAEEILEIPKPPPIPKTKGWVVD
jgi:uncharacterized protein (TIGR02266 family)